MKNLEKSLSGIAGLDEITHGGLPSGRTTLVCGKAGTGKSLLSLEFVYRGAATYDEPGVFISFEEKPDNILQNAASFGWNLEKLVEKGKLIIHHIPVKPEEIIVAGEFSLDGLLIQIQTLIDKIGAKRLALDTIETIFTGFQNHRILRAELNRIFKFFAERGITTIVTGEQGENALTRFGLEEYVSDCVIHLDLRVQNGIATRHLRIVKYRGSSHISNEFPFFIENEGINFSPITSVGLDYPVSEEVFSTGIPALDEMLGLGGIYRGTVMLISGTSGTGKTTLASSIASAGLKRGETCLFISFEESSDQIIRNMRSVGLDLKEFVENGSLHFFCHRPTYTGLEEHLHRILEKIHQQNPTFVVMDPVSNLINIAGYLEVKWMLTRLMDHLRHRMITVIFTDLTENSNYYREATSIDISSLMDTWIFLRDIESTSERNRGIYVLKSRGSAHSNQIREYQITSEGIVLEEVVADANGVLTGTARKAKLLEKEIQKKLKEKELMLKKAELSALQTKMSGRLKEMEEEFKLQLDKIRHEIELGEMEQELRDAYHKEVAKSRQKPA